MSAELSCLHEKVMPKCSLSYLKILISANNPPFSQNSFLYLLSNGDQDYTSNRQRMHRFRSRYTFFRFLLTAARRGNRLYFRTIGAGKTSLLNAVLGFVPLKAGSITVNGILLEKRNYRPNSQASGMDTARIGASIGMGEGNGTTPFNLKANRNPPFHWTNYLPVSMNWGWKRNCTINV